MLFMLNYTAKSIANNLLKITKTLSSGLVFFCFLNVISVLVCKASIIV